ncbi:MAG: hypothetical protein LKE29_02985 [Acidaminococcaceae bacterium]|nr:hypothetical protein [Acidaminococcaceae bacterium]
MYSAFDLKAVDSLAHDPRHLEVSATHYASPFTKSSIVDSLDVVILGATQVDTNFNVNVHTNSQGIIMGGSGGHSDAGGRSQNVHDYRTSKQSPDVSGRGQSTNYLHPWQNH